MIAGYVKLALANLAKHRLYAFINIAGLALGLCVFLFNVILVAYESDHDAMFSKRDRIFTAGSVFSPTSEEPVSEFPVIRTAYGPYFAREIEDAEQIAQ